MHIRLILGMLLALLLLPLYAVNANDGSLTTIRVGVLEFGTVNWELEVIQDRDLAKKRGINLVIVPLA